MRWEVSPEKSNRKKVQRSEVAQVTASNSGQLEAPGTRQTRGER